MNKRKVKKILAGISIASLVSGIGIVKAVFAGNGSCGKGSCGKAMEEGKASCGKGSCGAKAEAVEKEIFAQEAVEDQMIAEDESMDEDQMMDEDEAMDEDQMMGEDEAMDEDQMMEEDESMDEDAKSSCGKGSCGK